MCDEPENRNGRQDGREADRDETIAHTDLIHEEAKPKGTNDSGCAEGTEKEAEDRSRASVIKLKEDAALG